MSDRAVDYLPEDVSEPTELVNHIRARRGGSLLNLDRILLKSPEFAKGWNSMFSVLRGSSITVDKKYRELAICTIAVLNDAEYEFYQHEPDWRAAGGTDAQITAIRAVSSSETSYLECFDETEQQVIELTKQMTLNIKTDTALMKALKTNLGGDDAALIELCGVIGGYNMVSRFLVALDITADGERAPENATVVKL